MTPKRIQRKRTKGWKMPANAVYVGRPTIWGNPFTAQEGEHVEPKTLVLLYEIYLAGTFGFKKKYRRTREEKEMLIEFLKPLRGKNLVCWCPLYDKNGLRVPCHADILLALANNIPLEDICAPLTTQNLPKSNARNAKR